MFERIYTVRSILVSEIDQVIEAARAEQLLPDANLEHTHAEILRFAEKNELHCVSIEINAASSGDSVTVWADKAVPALHLNTSIRQAIITIRRRDPNQVDAVV